MKRPAGISVLALLLFANGAALTAQAALSLFSAVAFSSPFLSLYPATWTEALGYVFPVAGAVCSVAAAAGLWFLWEDARVGLVTLAAVPLGYYFAASLITLVLDSSRFAEEFTEAFCLRGIILAIVVVYLTRRHVKRAFGHRDRYFAEFDNVPEYDARVLLEYERQMEDEYVAR